MAHRTAHAMKDMWLAWVFSTMLCPKNNYKNKAIGTAIIICRDLGNILLWRTMMDVLNWSGIKLGPFFVFPNSMKEWFAIFEMWQCTVGLWPLGCLYCQKKELLCQALVGIVGSYCRRAWQRSLGCAGYVGGLFFKSGGDPVGGDCIRCITDSVGEAGKYGRVAKGER